MRRARPLPEPGHHDAGLQPERTSLAWSRTTLAMIVATAMFLRWFPEYGWFTGTLVAVSLCTAMGIYITQQLRYRRAVSGIANERIHADAAAAAWIAGSVVVLGALGLFAVLFLALD
ncbi:DUF202 domain-containing protein [Arthrobacter sp. NPDC089319]|uniref:DUF202 domain-containing protein n=1 Tax=Arthrobacter sp. NPDC089319 TaxID=3155915 RepID=UPI00341A5B35